MKKIGKLSIEELMIVSDIADRALSFYPGARKLSFVMDLQATHTCGCPLKLKELLDAEDFDFLHDIEGISQNINRETLKIENCFSPRYSK